MSELRFDSIQETMAFISRRKAEGAEVTMSPRAEAYFRAVAEQSARPVTRLELSDDGEHVLVDVAVDDLTGPGEDG